MKGFWLVNRTYGYDNWEKYSATASEVGGAGRKKGWVIQQHVGWRLLLGVHDGMKRFGLRIPWDGFTGFGCWHLGASHDNSVSHGQVSFWFGLMVGGVQQIHTSFLVLSQLIPSDA